MEKELLNLFCRVKKAADEAAAKEVLSDGPEVSRCMDALKQLRRFAITKELLVSTLVAKKLRSLTKHPKESIRSLASEIFKTWKAFFFAELNNDHEKDHSHSSTESNLKETTNKGADGHVRHDKIIIKIKLSNSKVQFGGKENHVKKVTTVSSDNIDASRKTIRERLVVALSIVSSEAHEESLKRQVEACDPVEVAALVETAMFEKIKDQKKKIRSILFNMSDPKNPDLRRKVLLGEVKPEQLMTMSNTEMASEELQLRIKQIEERALEKCQTGRSEAVEKATTDQFRCGRCGQRKTVYHQMQTRSADEPMTTYVTCVNCNNHWKFC